MMARKGRIDRVLLAAVMLISLLGVIFVYSATAGRGASGGLSIMVIKQCMWVAAGFLLLFVLANSDYRRLLGFAYFLYALNLAALAFVLFFGDTHYGARRWIDFGPVSLQPSEFVKITVILALAAFLGDRKEKTGSFGNFLGALILVMPAFGLIFLQPDLGTSLVLVPILLSILFICGERFRYILAVILTGLASVPFVWSVLKDYQKNRLMVFMNPDLDPLGAGYTIIQSKIAIGSGGLFGKGWLNGTQSYLKFLPERHTDFIFSVVGEEWGYAGAIIILALYAVVIARGIKVISRAGDVYGKAIATGVLTLVAFQVLVNISMTIGLMPVVGLPLPIISYGGSNAVTTLIGIGFLLSISRNTMR